MPSLLLLSCIHPAFNNADMVSHLSILKDMQPCSTLQSPCTWKTDANADFCTPKDMIRHALRQQQPMLLPVQLRACSRAAQNETCIQPTNANADFYTAKDMHTSSKLLRDQIKMLGPVHWRQLIQAACRVMHSNGRLTRRSVIICPFTNTDYNEQRQIKQM